MHDRIFEILYPNIERLFNERFAARTYQAIEIDAATNLTLFVRAQYLTAELLYHNQTKRDAIPDYFQLYEVSIQFVQSLLQNKIFKGVNTVSNIDLKNLTKYFYPLKRNDKQEKLNPNGKGKHFYKLLQQEYLDSINQFETIYKDRILRMKEKKIIKEKQEDERKKAEEEKRKKEEKRKEEEERRKQQLARIDALQMTFKEVYIVINLTLRLFIILFIVLRLSFQFPTNFASVFF